MDKMVSTYDPSPQILKPVNFKASEKTVSQPKSGSIQGLGLNSQYTHVYTCLHAIHCTSLKMSNYRVLRKNKTH